MNMFEQEALERKLRGILLVWGSFQVEVSKLIDSYKAESQTGQLYGAEIERPNESSLVIVCQRGGAPKVPFSSLMIRIKAEMISHRFSIDCKIERWRNASGASISSDYEKSMIFVLDSDLTSLILGKEKLTAVEAADRLLEILLSNK
jgi:hypothetical protein